MFREMRRKRQLLSEAETLAVLQHATSGVLAVQGDDDYPYAVPMSFAFEEGKLYFHAATAGHKMDAIRRNPRASFCVIDADQVVPDSLTTHFRSAIAFGTVRVLETDEEKRRALRCLSRKYAGDDAAADSEIDRDWARVCALELAIEHVTGKAAIEIVTGKAQSV